MEVPSILIVDDTEETREILRELLRYHGYITYEASDGNEAIEQTERLRPSLILADIAMPKMDGIGFVRKLKEDPKTASTPIIVMTATAQKEPKEEMRKLGCHAYLTKPLDLKVLVSIVNDILRNDIVEPLF